MGSNKSVDVSQRQVLQIITKKAAEEIKQKANEIFKNSRYSKEIYGEEEVLHYSNIFDELLENNKLYIKIYIKDHMITIIGWVLHGKREYSLGNNINLKTTTSVNENVKALALVLKDFLNIFEEFDSEVKCYSVNKNTVPQNIGQEFYPTLNTKEKNEKSIGLETILDIISIPACIISPIISILLVLFSTYRIYLSGPYKNQKKITKFIFISGITLLIIYVIIYIIIKFKTMEG